MTRLKSTAFGLCLIVSAIARSSFGSDAIEIQRLKDYFSVVRSIGFRADLQDRNLRETQPVKSTMVVDFEIDMIGKRIWTRWREKDLNPNSSRGSTEALLLPDLFHSVDVSEKGNARSVAVDNIDSLPKWESHVRMPFFSPMLGYVIKDGRLIDIEKFLPYSSVETNQEAVSIKYVGDATITVEIQNNPYRISAVSFDDLSKDAKNGIRLRYEVKQWKKVEQMGIPEVLKCTEERSMTRTELPPGMYMTKEGVLQVTSTPGPGYSRYSEAPASALEGTVTLSDIKLKKFGTEEIRLHVPISNGLKVLMLQSPQLDFVWRDGKPGPKRDVVEEIGVFPFATKSGVWRFSTVIVVLLLGSVGLYFWRFSKR